MNDLGYTNVSVYSLQAVLSVYMSFIDALESLLVDAGRQKYLHYMGQHRAYQAKTCSICAPLPFVLGLFPLTITLQYVVVCLTRPASHQSPPSHSTSYPPSLHLVECMSGLGPRVLCLSLKSASMNNG